MGFIAVKGFERLKNGAGHRAQGVILYCFIISMFQWFNGLIYK